MNKSKIPSAKKSKNMMYEQQLAHLPAKTLENLVDLIAKLKPKRYALILHDKDIDDKGQPVKPHIHTMLSFDNARSINSVAKLLGDKAQYIEAWNGNSNNGYAYLIHATDKARTKHQYDISEVKSNFDYPALMEKVTADVKKADTFGDSAKIKNFLNLLYIGAISKSEVEKQLTGAQYAKARKQIEDVWAKYQQKYAIQWREEMKASGKTVTVIWIYGTAGTGKSSFAKVYAQKKGNPYCMSGSSRGVFETYQGEHTLILDELRPDSVPYHDLLRILDPFGMSEQVMSPSRYNDKALTCDLIIITTPYSPLTFYYEIFNYKSNMIDGFEQLNRRITLTINMTDTEIFTATYDNTKGNFINDPTSRKPNPYSAANRKHMTVNAKDIYDSMFD